MYKFSNIKHDLPVEPFEKEALFDFTEHLMHSPYVFADDAEEICYILNERLNNHETYYLMHERMLHKGKLVKYIGHVVVSDKQNIIRFISDSLSQNDLRPMRILQVNSPAWLIRFTEDAVMYVYRENT